MARTPRAVAVDAPHHVTQRGNGRQTVFFADRDREVYLEAFFDYAARYSLRVWGYCLMSNHVHFVVVPEGDGAWRGSLDGRTAITRATRTWHGAAAATSGRRDSTVALWMRATPGRRSPMWKGTRCAPEWWRAPSCTAGRRRRHTAARTIWMVAWTWTNGGRITMESGGARCYGPGWKTRLGRSGFAKQRVAGTPWAAQLL